MSISKRENLQRVLRGDEPAWVPFSPNFNQWFVHHKKLGMLPEQLKNCRDHIDAMKLIDCDIFTRCIDAGYTSADTIKPEISVEQAQLGQRTTVIHHTRHGHLRAVSQMVNEISSAHTEEFLVKDWSNDGDAFLDWLDQRQYRWDVEKFLAADRRIGEDGLVNVGCGPSPLKFLHTTFGFEHSCLFAMDEPDKAKHIADAYWAKVRPVLLEMANHPKVESVILMDNVDTPFYPPSLAEFLWAPYVKDAAEIMLSRGKYLFVHACGKLKALDKYYAECRITGLEGVTHPPLGDWPACEAQDCHDGFVFNGGFSAHEQQNMTDDEVRAFYDGYLNSALKERFIFSSSCQTAIKTTWERILLVRDIVRAWGGAPDDAGLPAVTEMKS